jgi:hypothetical protein
MRESKSIASLTMDLTSGVSTCKMVEVIGLKLKVSAIF